MVIRKKSGYQNKKSRKEKGATQRKFEAIPAPGYLSNIPRDEIQRINQDLINHIHHQLREMQSASSANQKKSCAAKIRCEELRKKYPNLIYKGKKVSPKFIADAENISLSTVYRCLQNK